MDDAALQGELHMEALKALSRLNFAAGTAQVIWTRIRRRLPTAPTRPLRLLDIATGGGDIPIRLWRIARRAGVQMQIAGCDLSPRAIHYARSSAAASGADVQFFTQDVLNDNFAGDYDFLISSLFFHHLSGDEVVRLLHRLKPLTRRMLLVEDLRRGPAGLAIAATAARILSTSPVVRKDASRSVRAAFTPLEFQALAGAAGLEGATIIRHWPARFLLCWSPE
jgi:2-polyprenyl-3-methyl-5-hydroxy-6-metoxy-1,4-benzoquinol methylase